MRSRLCLITFSKLILGCFCINLAAGKPSWALPFKSSPQSFQQYANTIKWNGGASLYFENFYSCSKGAYQVANESSPRLADARRNLQGWENILANMHLSDGGTGAKPDCWRSQGSNCGRPADEQQRVENAWINRDAWEKLVQQYAAEYKVSIETYSCQGYVTISDPRGRKVCESTVNYDGQNGVSYTGRSCVWR